MSEKAKLSGTKAETLLDLKKKGYPVPSLFFFSVSKWNASREEVLDQIISLFGKNVALAVRSSAKAEDTAETSMAGAFHSILNVLTSSREQLTNSIIEVIESFDLDLENQVLIQEMVDSVSMSGVVMTRSLNDGSPYYVINYDDVTGKTDSVTSGNSINKTVYIYNGVQYSDFDSPGLLSVLKLVRALEEEFLDTPLDIEFAVSGLEKVSLLQVRRITIVGKWNHRISNLVSKRIEYLRSYVDVLMGGRAHLHGEKTLLGIMPDWNPAEMIGVVPHPLSMSLYRELITRNIWSKAREKMGYKKLPNVELMVSLFGRAYIDVRNSLNSFLPEGICDSTADRLINAYISKLESDPHLHDKIEFDIAFTCYDFDLREEFQSRYPELLSDEELNEFSNLLKNLTRQAVLNGPDSSLNLALNDIEKLRQIQSESPELAFNDPFAISDRINTLMDECMELGTLPFSIIARHGFIAEVLLRGAVKSDVLSTQRVSELRRSIKTVAGEMSERFYDVCTGKRDKAEFLKEYGHLRPSTYDVLSPRYHDRADLFDGTPQKPHEHFDFSLTDAERKSLNELLSAHNFDGVNADDLVVYAQKSIAGREYAKFIFTRHLSDIIELVAKWGEIQGIEREGVSMLSIEDIRDYVFAPLKKEGSTFYKKKIKRADKAYKVASSFKLNYLIRSSRDVNIVPMQRNMPNFIGNGILEGDIVFLTPYSKEVLDLRGKIVCIEGADPGYDWIFAKNIAGLVTKYGGANSHMAIRCAELDILAAIGCGEQPFERIVSAGNCLLDCQRMKLEPSRTTINH